MDIEKIKEIYGDSIIELINQNIDDVSMNIKYLKELGFTDVEDIFERYVYIFMEDNSTFKRKINKFINIIGKDYVSILENNMELWGKLL